MSDDAARDKLFTPAKLVVSSGSGFHWLISRQNPLFKQISDEAKGYLKNIAGGNLTRLSSSEDWGDISSRQGFVLEFGYEIKPELLGWFTGTTKVSGDAPAVLKLMIRPDSVDESLSEIYILDGGGNLFKYSVSNVSRPQSMQDIQDEYKKTGSPYRSYSSMRDSHLDKSFKYYQFEPDVLYITRPPEFWQYNQIQAEVPASVGKENELADIMLGNEKDRFNVSRGKDYLQFNNKENSYKIYDDGNLSYSYLPDTDDSDRGNIGDALLKAYSFIDRLSALTNQKAEIYLSGVDYSEQQNHYTFFFDYSFNEMPVAVNLQLKGGNGSPSPNAIKIDANGTKVLDCSWVLREFNQGKKLYYNDRFLDIMDFNGSDYVNMKVTDITAGYYLHSLGTAVIEPSLLVKLKDEVAPRAYGMLAGKGD